MKKSIIAILMATVILLSAFGSVLIIQTANAPDSSSWYMTVNGVLDTDTYKLYPYANKSLKLGFSKFGELIDNTTSVGLEYAGARDPFAPLASTTMDWPVLPKSVWINGWFIDIRYNHTSWGYRHFWAGALFADLSDYGRPWLRVDNGYGSCTYEHQEAFNLPGRELNATGEPVGTTLYNGGRKTNGTVITEDITVLYNGPRLFVAKLVNHIYDWYELTNIKLHIVDVVLTIMFNKVKKEVVVLKDVKFIPTAKFALSPLTITVPEQGPVSIPYGVLVQFSNREEWDLGLTMTGTTKYSSYVHLYTANNGEGQSTVYNKDWTMLRTLPANVTVAGVTVNKYGNEPHSSGTYDVAQIIANDLAYVGWHAFWPSLSDYQADAGRTDLWHRAILAGDRHDTDSYTVPNDEPFRSPLIVGEWDFLLSDTERIAGYVMANVQFRGVSVYGVTDRNNGDDINRAGGRNTLDREAKYQLAEVFNPWDLAQAVHKDTVRDVKFASGPLSSGAVVSLKEPLVTETWDEYCTFAERVLLLPDGILWKRGTQYSLWDSDEDGAYDSIKLITSVASGKTLKILYSTQTYWEEDDVLNFTFSEINSTYLDYDEEYEEWTDPLGATHELGVDNIKIEVDVLNENANWNATFIIDEDWGWADYFKVFKEDTAVISWDHDELLVRENENVSMTIWTDIHWYITPPYRKDLHVWGVEWNTIINVTIRYNATREECNITANVLLSYSYAESVPGRYEWGIAGNSESGIGYAETVDAIGLSAVSAAFKNKQIEYGLPGQDMYSPNPSNQMPWVMSKFGIGNTWANYYYSGTDYRTALKDDWCRTWPISSSNMIGVGGPLANMLAYYGNDFAQAIFGLNQFTDYAAWEDVIIPLTCWDTTKTRTYASSNTTGYAVISTYKDINGTVLFLIWGHWGRDTYYVTQWFHEEGIYQLQDAPRGLTAIIVQINYAWTAGEGYKPTGFCIPECLGTISETLWTHGEEEKGGIHDP